MNSLVFSLLAGGCSAISSLCFRKNADTSRNLSPSGYLLWFFLFAFLMTFVIFPEIFNAQINYIFLFIGICVGLLSSTLMLLTSRALQRGPAGLTFAFLNASAIFPGLVLFLIFGNEYGFSYGYLQLLGMVLVIIGLFIGTKSHTQNSTTSSSKWLFYALACFGVQVLALTCIQGRCILFESSEKLGMTFTQTDDVWFMPGQFGASFLMQAIIFLREKRLFQKSEIFYGCLGGFANLSSTALLLLSTKSALPFEKVILFPLFAVTSLVLCNLWATKLYSEKFNVKSNLLCSLGIFMAVS